MSFLLKDIYSKDFFDKISDVLFYIIPSFDKRNFLSQIFSPEFSDYELKERMSHTAKVLNNFLPDDFGKAAKVLIKFVKNLKKSGIKEDTIEFMFLPEYISIYGLENYDSAIKAIEFITQFTSCEFAVRPFIIKYEDKMIDQMLLWSNHPNRRVRRLATEGIRPRLPWAIALPNLKKNPAPIIPILENLKHDECESVRRSVANNLNDISKDNPDVLISTAKQWKGISKETDAILKHASRTLLKKGHPEILKFYKLNSKNFLVTDFKLITKIVDVGEYLEFEFCVKNNSKKSEILRLEYIIYFKKSNGSLSGKVFKICERELKSFEKINFIKRHSFKTITTRKYYSGEHRVAVLTNGKESNSLSFKLLSK